MPQQKIYDVVIIGGGIVGTATAMALQEIGIHSVLVLEAENKLAAHQTGNNSGVIHSGLYYKPGSLKAKNCVEGREQMYKFCEQHNIKHDRCGKIVVAVKQEEVQQLQNLEERGIANGLTGIKRLSSEELKEYEPHVKGLAGLFIAETGIVDYNQVTETYAKIILENGGEVKTNSKFLACSRIMVCTCYKHSAGEHRAKFLVNCAGLYSDRVAKICGAKSRIANHSFPRRVLQIKKRKRTSCKKFDLSGSRSAISFSRSSFYKNDKRRS